MPSPTWPFWRAVLRHPWVTQLTEQVTETLQPNPLPQVGGAPGCPDAHTHTGYRLEVSFRWWRGKTVVDGRLRDDVALMTAAREIPMSMIEQMVEDPFVIARDSIRRELIAWVDAHVAQPAGLTVGGARWQA